ncbi:hypothetical protein M430DRAFT_93493 [Amorphotheca resinae ATCC 22711]|uniref:Transcription initiation factor TFIID subunit 13 n=1 Tax=Amorphotheca resinae ATCC 22711 TaxID=857342 RepID=A0A2T3BD26_AMORE|nr:hypothetical protein M430DRAFT_93493 [Amorphotheca resinae ATCC 22711]PSS27295.1 hypothetical protein M430DRAFT_93493 [Amorphotheca resinae ATCC 22711]
MEPRARIGRNRGQQSFSDQELQHFLYAHGDVPHSLDTTKRVLDELLTDFITELCFEAHRSAQLAGRQKIKIDDVRFACRKNPLYLGKIQEMQEKKDEIDRARKTLDVNDDKITKSNVKALEEEPLGDADDDMDMDTRTIGGKSSVGGR